MKKWKLIEKYRFLFLFLVLIFFFVFKSISFDTHYSRLANYGFLLLIAYSLFVIGKKRRFLLLSLSLLAVANLIFFIAEYWIDSQLVLGLKVFFAILFFLLMTYACIYFMLMDRYITVTTLFGAMCSYLFIGLTFSYLYMLLFIIDPASFMGMDVAKANFDNDFIYYSFVTLTTIGYGDIAPAQNLAKTFSWMEAYFGQVFLTIIMAMLVGRYIASHQQWLSSQRD